MRRLLVLGLLAVAAGAETASAQTEAERKARPCAFQAKYRAFDFWLGDWNVHNAKGQLAGTNRIESLLDGCILMEHWTGRAGGPGSTGKSMNYYNAATGKWRQVWIWDNGGVWEYEGEFRDGAMRLERRFTREGKPVLQRLTLLPLPDGRVRQHFENSTDDGDTWATTFDGYYSRKP